VPSVRRRDIVGSEGPRIGRFVHLLKLPDVIDNAFNIHWRTVYPIRLAAEAVQITVSKHVGNLAVAGVL
jgi:hypothetical protein